MIRRHPEWVRSCANCSKWVMDARGGFVTDAAGNRFPQQSPPCWSCPKQPADVPPDQRKPLAMADDFAPWVWDVRDWYAAGRAVGFGEVEPLMREVAAVLLRDERAGEREEMRRAVADGLRELLRKR